MRRYDEPIEVRLGSQVGDRAEGPAQFLWRNRLWRVLEVQSRWVESSDWWNGPSVRAARGVEEDAGRAVRRFAHGEPERRDGVTPYADWGPINQRVQATPHHDEDADLLGEQEIWRVEASSGRHTSPGVYELAHSWGTGGWVLRSAVD
ncbi:MAG TPA: DUF6504 family protein [Propionibacteriaceae bacterium]|nr:DUF6504 family protein [Propionibacteriaceae bacterium]